MSYLWIIYFNKDFCGGNKKHCNWFYIGYLSYNFTVNTFLLFSSLALFYTLKQSLLLLSFSKSSVHFFSLTLHHFKLDQHFKLDHILHWVWNSTEAHWFFVVLSTSLFLVVFIYLQILEKMTWCFFFAYPIKKSSCL